MIRWLIRLTRGYRLQVALSIGLGSLTIFSSIGLFGSSAYLISMAAYQPSIAVLQVAIVGVRFFGISRSVFRYLERLATHSVNLKLLASLRSWIFENLLKKYPIREDELTNAEVLGSLIQAVDVLENFYVRLFSPIFVAVIITVSTAIFFGIYSIELFLIMLLGLSITGFLLPWLAGNAGHETAKKLEEARFAYQEEIVSFSDSFQELSLLQASTAYINQMEELEKKWARQKDTHNLLQAGFNGLGFYSTQGVFLVVLVVTAGLVMNGSMEAVMMAVLSLICLASFEAVLNLPVSAQLWGDIRAAVRRIRKLDLMNEYPTVLSTDNVNQKSIPAVLVINDLRFRYADHLENCLSDINLRLDAGKKIAIVGESGSGKSTLLNILLGFYPDYEGEILVNGLSSRSMSANKKREFFSSISASSYFFDTTLFQNFLLANPSLAETDVEQILLKVGLSQLADKRSQSISSFLNDRIHLSSGEMQRLNLARALIRRAEVYLFDEPTANLDPLLSKTIIADLFKILEDKSLIFITHQYFLMDRFDEIIVLKDGKIVERGKNKELLDIKGYYYQLYRAHFPEVSYNLSH